MYINCMICILQYFMQYYVINIIIRSYTNDLITLKDDYKSLSKRKQDICKDTDKLKHKDKIFPPIVKPQNPKTKQDHSIGDNFLVTTTTVSEQNDEFLTMNEIKEEFINKELNVKSKISASSKELSKLTKQFSHCDSLENIEEVNGENEWKKYCDHDMILPSSVVEDFGKDIFNENQSNISN